MKTYSDFIEETDLDLSGFDIYKEEAYIVKEGGEWCIKSEKGKNLGCYSSRKKAEERLREIERFKHMKNGSNEDLEKARQECYCMSCSTYFFSKRNLRCDQSKCPVCGDPDSSVEVTGIIE